jgi:hypothetical protein
MRPKASRKGDDREIINNKSFPKGVRKIDSCGTTSAMATAVT